MPPLVELSKQKLANHYYAAFGKRDCPELYLQNSFTEISPKMKKTHGFCSRKFPKKIMIDAEESIPYGRYGENFNTKMTVRVFSTFCPN